MKTLITLALGIVIVVLIGWWTRELCKPKLEVVAYELISISELQELLNEIEPTDPIEVDGKLGPATQEKWDRLVCNAEHQKAMERMGLCEKK